MKATQLARCLAATLVLAVLLLTVVFGVFNRYIAWHYAIRFALTPSQFRCLNDELATKIITWRTVEINPWKMTLVGSQVSEFGPSKLVLVLDREYFTVPSDIDAGAEIMIEDIIPIDPMDQCHLDKLTQRRLEWLNSPN